MTFIDELKAILDRYGDGPFTEEIRIQRYGEVTNCMSLHGWNPRQVPASVVDPLRWIFQEGILQLNEEQRIRLVVREEVKQAIKAERETFTDKLSQLFEWLGEDE